MADDDLREAWQELRATPNFVYTLELQDLQNLDARVVRWGVIRSCQTTDGPAWLCRDPVVVWSATSNYRASSMRISGTTTLKKAETFLGTNAVKEQFELLRQSVLESLRTACQEIEAAINDRERALSSCQNQISAVTCLNLAIPAEPYDKFPSIIKCEHLWEK